MSEQQLSDLNTQLVQARASTAEAKARLDRIDAISDQDVAQSTVTDALNNSVITRLRAQYLDLRAQYADWSRRYGKTHLAAVNLANKMEELRKNIADELRRIADAYRSDYEIAKSREASLEKNVKELVAQAGNTGQAEVKLRDLESAADTYRNLYNNFLEKLQSATQNQSFPLSEARLISTAAKPDRKSSPRTVLALVGGLVGGLCLGFGAAFARELLSDVLRTPGEVEDELGVKCLGVLPDIRPPTKAGALLSTLCEDRPSRSVPLRRRSSVLAVCRDPAQHQGIDRRRAPDPRDQGDRHRLVASKGRQDDGGRQLRAADRPHGHRAVLIDGDLHTRSLTRELAPNAKTGLVEALNDPASLGYHVQRSKETGLDFPALRRGLAHGQFGRRHRIQGNGRVAQGAQGALRVHRHRPCPGDAGGGLEGRQLPDRRHGLRDRMGPDHANRSPGVGLGVGSPPEEADRRRAQPREPEDAQAHRGLQGQAPQQLLRRARARVRPRPGHPAASRTATTSAAAFGGAALFVLAELLSEPSRTFPHKATAAAAWRPALSAMDARRVRPPYSPGIHNLRLLH